MTLQQAAQKIGENIRERRQHARMTQAQLAKAIKKSGNYVGLLERGDRMPSIETVLDIAQLLGAPLEAFFVTGKEPEGSERSRVLRKLTGFLSNKSPKDIETVLRLTHALLRR